jgi:hypothetical protein
MAMFTNDENEREIYELRLKYQRDHDGLVQYLRDAAKEAEERGVEKGMEKGMEKGALMGQVRLFQELLKQSPTPQLELSALPEETLAALLAELRKQLIPIAANPRGGRTVAASGVPAVSSITP